MFLSANQFDDRKGSSMKLDRLHNSPCTACWAMSRTISVIMFVLIATTSTLAAESYVDGPLLLAARKALPQSISTNDLVKVLQAGLWNSNRTGVAISLPRQKAKGSLVFVFLRQTNGVYLAVEASGVEGGNLGKLGIAGPAPFDRIETTPIRWHAHEDGVFHVEMRTRAWKDGKRYTVSEPLLIRSNGTILWR